MQINYKRLLFDIFITFLIGNLFLFTIDTYFYDHLIKPFSVPSFVFPVVWSFLYLVMGISLYLIEESSSPDKKSTVFLYYFQLIVNSLWVPIFFYFKWFLFDFIWLIFLLYLVCILLYKFYFIQKITSYINIPYLLWLLFASYLNFYIYYFNG